MQIFDHFFNEFGKFVEFVKPATQYCVVCKVLGWNSSLLAPIDRGSGGCSSRPAPQYCGATGPGGMKRYYEKKSIFFISKKPPNE